MCIRDRVFGPNRVVIWEETVPIWLDPAQPFHYQFSLPSDRGEPYGLRIHVHDPLDFDWALQLISDSVTTLYNTLARPSPAAASNCRSVSPSA